jgi:hypothetical protein
VQDCALAREAERGRYFRIVKGIVLAHETPLVRLPLLASLDFSSKRFSDTAIADLLWCSSLEEHHGQEAEEVTAD